MGFKYRKSNNKNLKLKQIIRFKTKWFLYHHDTSGESFNIMYDYRTLKICSYLFIVGLLTIAGDHYGSAFTVHFT